MDWASFFVGFLACELLAFILIAAVFWAFVRRAERQQRNEDEDKVSDSYLDKLRGGGEIDSQGKPL